MNKEVLQRITELEAEIFAAAEDAAMLCQKVFACNDPQHTRLLQDQIHFITTRINIARKEIDLLEGREPIKPTAPTFSFTPRLVNFRGIEEVPVTTAA